MIYTRNYGKPSRSGGNYRPPPGYDGNAFPQAPDDVDVKLHEAEDDVTNLRRSRESARELPPENADRFEERPLFPEPEEEGEGEGENPKPQSLPEPDFGAEPGKPDETESVPVFAGGIQAFESLFRQLRGKFGREELIIVLVMLLISSDGASVELMLLALILIAG